MRPNSNCCAHAVRHWMHRCRCSKRERENAAGGKSAAALRDLRDGSALEVERALLRAVEGRQILHVLTAQVLDLAGHDGVLARAQLVVEQRTVQILGNLSADVRESRRGAGAVRAMAGRTGGGQLLAA